MILPIKIYEARKELCSDFVYNKEKPKMEQKICVIGVYFGTLPNYFQLWLRSCEHNKGISFYLFTDADLSAYVIPANVQWNGYSLNQMRERASEVLGFEAALYRPYKCCDFKPLYGEIFSEYIKEFDYWGHCDFDLIWGDLSYYFDLYRINEYEKFLPLGHLCLYKNTRVNNMRYILDGSKCGDYILAFSSKVHRAFDEELGIGAIFDKHNIPTFKKRIFADISDSYKRYQCARRDKNYKYQVFFWRKGKVYRAYWDNGKIHEEEFLYIHFQKRGYLPVHDDCENSTGFFITNTGFYPLEAITLDVIKKYNPYRSLLFEKTEKFISRLKKRWIPGLLNKMQKAGIIKG